MVCQGHADPVVWSIFFTFQSSEFPLITQLTEAEHFSFLCGSQVIQALLSTPGK